MRAKRYAIALTALMRGLATLAGAGSAAPANPDVGARLTSAAAATEPAQPPNLRRMTDFDMPAGLRARDVTQVVTKQKLKIKLPQQEFLVYEKVCVNLPFSGGLFLGFNRFGAPTFDCAQSSVDQLLHAQTLMPAEAWPDGMYGISGDSWIQSPPGSERPFGTFPPVRVHTVAFGSVPITATVHISQHMRDGLIQPMHLQWTTTGGYVPEGVVIPGYGASPGYPYSFELPPTFNGPVDIRLSDVSVDGVPLPVGDNCVAPADLTFTPRPGFYSLDSPNQPPVKGEPGEFSPVVAPSYLPGTVDIKSFAGCQHGSEDLDPLLTGMISGPGNPIEATMNMGLADWCGPRDDGHPPIGRSYCDLKDTPLEGDSAAGLRAMELSARSLAPSATTGQKSASSLSAKQLATLRAHVTATDRSQMSKPIRKLWDQMMRALPPEVRPGGK